MADRKIVVVTNWGWTVILILALAGIISHYNLRRPPEPSSTIRDILKYTAEERKLKAMDPLTQRLWISDELYFNSSSDRKNFVDSLVAQWGQEVQLLKERAYNPSRTKWDPSPLKEFLDEDEYSKLEETVAQAPQEDGNETW